MRIPWVVAVIIFGDQLVKYLIPNFAHWPVHEGSLWSWPLALLMLTLLYLMFRGGSQIAQALIIGGGVSNLLDVFLRGFVADPFVVKNFAFNLADLAILVGFVITLRGVYKSHKKCA